MVRRQLDDAADRGAGLSLPIERRLGADCQRHGIAALGINWPSRSRALYRVPSGRKSNTDLRSDMQVSRRFSGVIPDDGFDAHSARVPSRKIEWVGAYQHLPMVFKVLPSRGSVVESPH